MAVITALFFRQFERDLVTLDTRVVTGLGANRPSATILRYRRKPQSERAPAPDAILPA